MGLRQISQILDNNNYISNISGRHILMCLPDIIYVPYLPIERADTGVCPYVRMTATLARDSPPSEGRGRFSPPKGGAVYEFL